jgi:hypothetical protein
MLKIRPSSIGFCALGVVMVIACHKPRSEGYRRVEFFSAGKSRLEFTCMIGRHSWDTFVGTTPWQIELDLDTMHECICGTHCRITRSEPGPDKLWVWGFDGDSLRLDKYLVSPSDTVDFHMRSWICYQGEP